MARSDSRSNPWVRTQERIGSGMWNRSDSVSSGAILQPILGDGYLGAGSGRDRTAIEIETRPASSIPVATECGKLRRDGAGECGHGDSQLGGAVFSEHRIPGGCVGEGGQNGEIRWPDNHWRCPESAAVESVSYFGATP